MKLPAKDLNSDKYKYIPVVVWVAVLLLSLFWNLQRHDAEREKIARHGARSLFHFIASVRSWNESHEGIYAAISAATTPNPYIDLQLRDIEVNQDLTLTKVSPDYMIRLLSETAAQGGGVQFGISSMNPLRPGNRAKEWEKKALQSFDSGKSEYGSFEKQGDGYNYRYMAPLYAFEECLDCHDKQGYEVGDICGGISVILPLQEKPDNWPLFLTHVMAAIVGAVLYLLFLNHFRASQEKMHLLACRDSLTGVANRRFFLEYLRREWLRAKRNGTTLSFILCDIDLFKQYNSTYGHQAGDNCLSQVAQAISSVLKRPGDFIARYGGVKFAVILPETPIEGAQILAGEMLRLVEELKIEHLHSLASKYITVSIGLSDNLGLSSSNEIVAHAAEALAHAKETGRNRVVHFSRDEDLNVS